MNERTIFLEALEQTSPASRREYLDKACADDAELRERVEALLRAYDQRGGIVDDLMAAIDERTSTMSPGSGPVDNTLDSIPSLSFLGPATTPDTIGTLGNYEVIEVIGRGGMGVVLKARDTRLQRIVAIKVLAAEIAANPNAKKRFEREAQAAAAVSHDHVVTIYAVDEFNGLPFIVMECIVGRTLQQKIEETGPLELREILRIGMQIATGLAAAHQQGLVHRDIKPGNILLQNGIQRVKITDFGLARAVDDVGMTHTGQIAGTPLYMSPEQAQGLPVDHQSDLFSLGSVLYTMCAGRPAFRAGGTMAVLRRVCDDEPRPLEAVNAEIPEWLVEIIRKLMSKSKEDRFARASDVATLLGDHLARIQEPRPAAISKPVDRQLAVTETHAPETPSSSSSARKSSKPGKKVRSDDDSRPRQKSPPTHMRSPSALTWMVGLILVPGVIVLIVMMAMLMRRDQLQIRIDLDDSLRDPDLVLLINRQAYAADNLPSSMVVSAGNLLIEVRRGSDVILIDEFLVGAQEKPVFRITSENGLAVVVRTDIAVAKGPVVQVPLVPQGVTVKSKPVWPDWDAAAPAPAIAPFDSNEARRHQDEWAAYLKIPVEFTNSLGMTFRLIPPGEFTMGASPAEIEQAVEDGGDNPHWVECARGAGPQHTTVVTRPFYLGVHEVTQGQFQQLTTISNSAFNARNPAVAGLDVQRLPVEQMLAADTIEFCESLTAKERSEGRLTANAEYSLPTEAEWEFSCRAGTTTLYWSGNTEADLLRVAWTEKNAGKRTHVVGELPANPFGLHDMHGNVFEVVSDWWDGGYYRRFANQPAVNPVAGLASLKTMRGGAFEWSPSFCRSAARFNYFVPHAVHVFGFRVKLSIDSPVLSKQPVQLNTPENVVATTGWNGWPTDGPAPAIAPFTADQAASHVDEWARRLGVDKEVSNRKGMKFRLIPPGEYRMGTSIKEFLNEQPLVTAHESDHRLATERPQHRVVITTPFFLGIHEVTQDQYESVMGENPSHFRKGGAGEASVAGMESADWPVDSVSVSDAVDFCIKLSQFDQFEVLYERQNGFDVPINPTRPGYRLPTEAEWEWACRAGTNTRFWSSDRDRDLKEVAWFKGNSTDLPHPVGKLKANPFGLFDVSGNVGELCVDGFTYIYFQTELDRRYAVDPFFRATSGQPRVVRGGNSLSQPESLRPAMRTAIRPDHKDPNTGFRVVLTIEGARNLKQE